VNAPSQVIIFPEPVMEISWCPVRVSTGSRDEDGRMALVNDKLVAILVLLADDYEAPELQGKWFVEAGFGCLSGKHEIFGTLDEAEAWVRQHCEADIKRRSGRTFLS
jgi:hypothetical protein